VKDAGRTGAPTQPVIFRRGNTAEAVPAVPGWRMAAADIFAAWDDPSR
jgi:hypothetical protein